MKQLFLSFLLVLTLCFPFAICSMELDQPKVKSPYAWLSSAAKDTGLATLCTAAGYAVAPIVWETLRETPVFDGADGLISSLNNYAQCAKMAFSATVGAAICYRAYKAQQNKSFEINMSKTASSDQPTNIVLDSYSCGNSLNPMVFYNKSRLQSSEIFSETKTVSLSPLQPRGLSNPHNNCFMNAVLQVLTNIPEISTYFSDPLATNLYKPQSVSQAYITLMAEIITAQAKNTKVLSSEKFCTAARTIFNFGTTTQEDAQEFFSLFLDKLSDADFNNNLNIPKHGYPYNYIAQTELSELFTVILQSKTKSALGIRAHQSPEKLLSLQIPQQTSNSDRKISLRDLFNNFFNREVIDPIMHTTISGKIYKCDQKKQLSLINAPQFLTIQLKRFDGSNQKINTPVTIPLEIDLSKYYDNKLPTPVQYKLQAIIVHSGTGAKGGHYYTHINKGSSWYYCNDSSVNEFPHMHYFEQHGYYQKNALPYMLFYKRTSAELSSNLSPELTREELIDALTYYTISHEQLEAFLSYKKMNLSNVLKGIHQQFITIAGLSENIHEYINAAAKPKPFLVNQAATFSPQPPTLIQRLYKLIQSLRRQQIS